MDLGIAKPTSPTPPSRKPSPPSRRLIALGTGADGRALAPALRGVCRWVSVCTLHPIVPHPLLGETQSRNGAWGLHLHHESSAGSTPWTASGSMKAGPTTAPGLLRRFIDRSSLTLDGGSNRQAWGLHGLDLDAPRRGTFSAPMDRQTYGRLTSRSDCRTTCGTAPKSTATWSWPLPG